jgi:hypothetical protein
MDLCVADNLCRLHMETIAAIFGFLVIVFLVGIALHAARDKK